MRLSIAVCALSLCMPLAAQPDAPRQVQLNQLLRQDCGSCHGLSLKGGLGPALLPQRLRGQSVAALFATIKYGRPGTAMPPWGPLLNDEDIQWLAQRLLAGEGDHP